MAHHDLKILPGFFEAVVDGKKTFEIRINDRDFKEGDSVTLHEYSSCVGGPESNKYTGRACGRVIGYVTDFAQQPGYVVFSLV